MLSLSKHGDVPMRPRRVSLGRSRRFPGMSWEAVTAVSTAITTIILLLTVVLGRHQLTLLRASTQLEGIFRILHEVKSSRNDEARRFVLHDLPKALLDPRFVQEIIDGTDPEDRHKERIVLQLYEEVGAYLKFTLIDSDFLYCQAGPPALRCWEKLRPVVALYRKRSGPNVWDSYELFVNGTIAYARRENPKFDPGFEVAPEGADAQLALSGVSLEPRASTSSA